MCPGLTIFQLQCLNAHLKYHPTAPKSPTSPTSSEATLISNLSETTTVEEDLISSFERVHFYTGVSEDHPLLLHRSDVRARPFVIPRERHSVIPEKTARGVHHPVLKNELWKKTVAPEIITLLKDPSRGVRVSSMLPVRFSTPDDDGNDVLDDHIVLWISVHPNTTKETSCRDVNTEILAILFKHGVQDVAVHWIEGAVEPLVGLPEMMRVVRDTDPTHYIRRALTAVLGVPLTAQELAYDDAQGTLGLYFHLGQDRDGNKSRQLMGLTNKRVTSKHTNQDYQYNGRPGAPQQFIRNCGRRRFEELVDETRAFMAEKLGDVTLFAEQLAEILAKPKSEEEAEQDKRDLKRKQEDLKRAQDDVEILSDFLKLLNSTWSDPLQRIVGWLDWAPKIANNLDDRRYTRDLGVIALNEAKFAKSFKGNFVYLGAFCFYLFLFPSSSFNGNMNLFSWQVHPRRYRLVLLPQ